MQFNVQYSGMADRAAKIEWQEILGRQMLSDTFIPEWARYPKIEILDDGKPTGRFADDLAHPNEPVGVMVWSDAPTVTPKPPDYKALYAAAADVAAKQAVIAKVLGLI